MDLTIAIKAAVLSVLASLGITAGVSESKIQEHVQKAVKKLNHGAEVSVVARANKTLMPAATPRVKATPSPTPIPTATPNPEYKNHGAEVGVVAKKDALKINLSVK